MKKKTAKLTRCRLTAGLDHKITGCGVQNTTSGFFCTRPKGHKGNHIACCPSMHNLDRWV